ncbi:MAG: DNA mismatch repair endonuclease MutL [Flavobacteriales bacterium]|nr:DNA mismatch repair endonuclease MutL [Flavobacteriales bacterium]
MGDLIRLLPDHVANQIAAGEVVQRPASMVKELLENSVDAGAGRIILVVKDAGRSLVQVTDDGRGMSMMDARMCFERHATSKIRVAHDLQAVRTKGFRGEALASIAAIAQVELKTRPHADEVGTRVLIEGSRLVAQEPVACPPGTTLAVRNLFFNTPARRQFLKSDQVEMKHVLDEFQRVALAHPEIAFQLTHNGQEVHQLPAAQGQTPGALLRQRVVHLFGRRYDERLVPVEESAGDLHITGFVGKPEFARRSRGEQFFFVNQRFIRSSYLEHAVRAAFEELVARDQYPSWFLYIDLDPARIDINIHPTKTEIKFRDDRSVYAIVHAAVRRALGRFNVAPSIDFEPEPALLAASMPSTPGPAAKAWRPQDLGMAPPPVPSGWQRLFDLPDAPAVDSPTDSPLVMPSREHEGPPGARPVFQLHGTYILAQVRSGVVVVDQQRARERIVYEQALRTLEQGAGHSQQQLFPRNVELSPGDHALLTQVLPELRALGFDLEPLGGRTIVVNGMPAEAADEDPVALLESFLEQLQLEQGTLRNARHTALARSMARSLAPRSTRKLENAEMHELIDRLFACEMPYVTPSGRPTLLTFTLDELNERFGN